MIVFYDYEFQGSFEMGTITLFNSIERPVNIVQDAIREGFLVYKDQGAISVFSHSMHGYFHYAELNTMAWPKELSHISLSIQLNSTANMGNRTFIRSTIKYKTTTKFFLWGLARKVVLKKQIRVAASRRFHEFKYRLEKWL
ncbi:hypothetical protein MTsPCn5_18550 [Croceitalea sp. MTPC5]|uniref:hypothetical protein n=1 Tax=Croceitalea sp. MTPC5 TaxID=3056565 RepID=UPI002B3ED579|nr:hypothetical protein MTsPCn5_18550 [Croceitalea sp. MTPC5]